jgi:enamine deaminase RidA (YjgF/YER057c/UK114 family)
MKTIRSPKVAEAPPQTWSNMKVANGYFHIAGMTGSGPKGEHPGDDMYIQAKSIFQKFKDMLEAAGGEMNDIMSITVYVTNLDENTEVWRARREFFTGDFPCSTLIEVKRVGSPKASPPLKVEINATGVIGAGGQFAVLGVQRTYHREPGPNGLGSASDNYLRERSRMIVGYWN